MSQTVYCQKCLNRSKICRVKAHEQTDIIKLEKRIKILRSLVSFERKKFYKAID